MYEILYLIITVLLLTICLFLADKLIGDKPDSMGGGYFLKALITAIVIIALIIGVGAVVGALGILGISGIAPILGFVLAAYAVKMLLLASSTYERAVWVTLVAYIFVFMINYLAQVIGHITLIQYI